MDYDLDKLPLWCIVQADGDKACATSGGSTPIQFCRMGDSPSLLQCALHRALNVAPRRRVIATVAAAHRRWWSQPLWCVSGERRIVDQSTGRLTVTLAAALALIEKEDADALVVVQATDAFCASGDAFTAGVVHALQTLEKLPAHIVALTTEPFVAASNQDYLVFGPRDGLPGRPAVRFVKRPAPVIADRLVAVGAHVSMGVYVARVATLTSVLQAVWPDLMAAARALVESGRGETLMPVHMPGSRFCRPWRHTWIQRPLPRLRAVPVDDYGWKSLGSTVSISSGLSG